MDISKENTIITSLSRQPVSGSLNDVITTVHYQIFASASINGTSSLAYVQKNLDLESPNPNAFTPFDDITKSVIYGWIQSPQGEFEYNQAISELEQILSSSILAEKVETLPVSMSLFER